MRELTSVEIQSVNGGIRRAIVKAVGKALKRAARASAGIDGAGSSRYGSGGWRP